VTKHGASGDGTEGNGESVGVYASVDGDEVHMEKRVVGTPLHGGTSRL